MLKYLYIKELFAEIPNEITLGISISGCKIHCEDCHSKELWEDKGKELTLDELQNLIDKHKGITCVLLLGGEHDIDYLSYLFQQLFGKVKTAWYCGLDRVPKDKVGIAQYLDYLKIGSYKKELGGLDSPTTNQKLWRIKHLGDGTAWHDDITHLLQKNKIV